MATKQYIYWMRMRPPAPGAQPMEGLIKLSNREIWYDGSHYWGECIYGRELSRKEIDDYEMELHKVINYD